MRQRFGEHFRVMLAELGVGLLDTEQPLHAHTSVVALLLPGCDIALPGLTVGDASVQSLAHQKPERGG